jgi:hypothetical protein
MYKTIPHVVGSAVVIGFLLSAIIYISYSDITVTSLKSKAVENASSATLILSDGTTRQFTGPVVDRMTVLEALQAASNAGGFDLIYTMQGNAVKIVSMDNQFAMGDHTWIFFLNDRSLSASRIATTYIHAGDILKAEYK